MVLVKMKKPKTIFTMNISAFSMKSAKNKIAQYNRKDKGFTILNVKLNKKMSYGDLKVYTVKYRKRKKRSKRK